MSIDLTAVVEASARGSYTDAPGDGPAWEDLPEIYRHEVREIALDFITHAAPLIEAAVREQIAQEEKDEPPTLSLWADGATTDQRDTIFSAAVDAALAASDGMDGVSVGAVGSLSDVRGEQQ